MPSPAETKRHRKRRKQVRRQRRVRVTNVSARSAASTAVRRAREAIEGDDHAVTDEAVRAAQSVLDAAGRKGVIHPRQAARRVSRLKRRQGGPTATAGEAS